MRTGYHRKGRIRIHTPQSNACFRDCSLYQNGKKRVTQWYYYKNESCPVSASTLQFFFSTQSLFQHHTFQSHMEGVVFETFPLNRERRAMESRRYCYKNEILSAFFFLFPSTPKPCFSTHFLESRSALEINSDKNKKIYTRNHSNNSKKHTSFQLLFLRWTLSATPKLYFSTHTLLSLAVCYVWPRLTCSLHHLHPCDPPFSTSVITCN